MVKAHAIYNDFAAASRPFRAEVGIEDVEVEGTIPKELNGTFYRVMQDPYYERDYYLGGSKTIAFDGDGNISAFRIKDGKVSFQQKYVMTERLVAERKAGRALFGMFASPFSHHPCVRAVLDSAANTNIIIHANKLLALSEFGPAYELDPNSLRTIGHDAFEGVDPRKPFTAHPHVDPKTGDLVGFGYQLNGLGSPEISIYVINKHGKTTFKRDLEFQGGGIIHDCAVTENYVVLMRMPFMVDYKDHEKPGKHQYYDEKCPAWFGVIPRNESAPIRWFKYKNCMSIHTGASWEENGKIPASRHGENPKPSDVTVNYVKWCIDPWSESDTIPDPGRYTYMDCYKPDGDNTAQLYQGLNTLARLDYKTGSVEYFSPGPSCLVQEPCFSPRHPDAEEGDGFIITMIDNQQLNRNEVIIQDTKDFQSVVAKIILPFRLRSAVHGNWVDAERIPETEPAEIQSIPDIYPNVPTVKAEA
ncbi:hypothetical protein CDV31_010522 [Fusarium ambrosium]|uniref:Lignostilbene-alpha,beta-dioxygenase isozyme I n=1 Tax=Fusarium ambrosium TaxID=131363 RepID=A0A428TMY6_9HYPO|nr:hypothetical protein CDV31_010522 [Fusarium ambrosium]